MQSPMMFRNKGQLISGMLHVPGRARARVPAVLLCHGFTGQKIETHRLFVTLSRALEGRGVASLRFDFRGSGESEGAFNEMTVSGEISDAHAAFAKLIAHSKIDPGRIGVLGLSLGGCVAACLAGQEKRIASLALWSTVADPAELLTHKLSPQEKGILRRKGYLDRAGMPVGRAFFRGLPSIHPLEEVAKSDCPILIVHGTEDKAVPLGHAERYYEVVKPRSARVQKYILKGADHVFSTVKWTNRVVKRTAEWFAQTLI
ncbi:MAG: alpha/beta fold hydrolase [Planctomycetes bacterium]|nr:alpha/beta fold hydrolase [Planctomycetota bacterium]